MLGPPLSAAAGGRDALFDEQRHNTETVNARGLDKVLLVDVPWFDDLVNGSVVFWAAQGLRKEVTMRRAVSAIPPSDKMLASHTLDDHIRLYIYIAHSIYSML